MPRKSRFPVQKSLSMSEEAARAVEVLADAMGVPESLVLRQAVDEYLGRHTGRPTEQPPQPPQTV